MHDESDELKRAARFGPQGRARRACFRGDRGPPPELTAQTIDTAYDGAADWARQRWKTDYVTLSVAQRLAEGYRAWRSPQPQALRR